MTDAVASTYRKLADLQAAGKHYEVHSPGIRGVFDASFCAMAAADKFISRLDDLIACGNIIKDETSTTVSRTSWQGHDIVIKRYNNQGVLHSLRHTLKGSRARRVWLYGHLLNNLGIATPPPLACIEVRNHHLLSSSYIVTPYVNAANLHHFIRNKYISAGRLRNVLTEVADLLDTMARHKLTHGDLKHSNILISDSGPVLTDLDGLRIHKLDITHRRGQQRDSDRFMRSATMDDLPQATKDMVMDIFGSPARWAAGTEGYQKVRIGAWSLIIKSGLAADEAMGVFSGERGISAGDERTRHVISSDLARIFTCQVAYQGASRTVYVKHFLPRSVLEVVKHLFRSSRAARAFEASLLLRRNGFDSPEPLALLEKGYGPFCSINVLVTDAIAEALHPSTYLKECLERPSSAKTRDKRRAIRQLGHIIGRMHAKGIFHGDLRSDNVLLQSGDGEWKFHFIDNERTRQFIRLPQRLRLKNLVQLNMTGQGLSRTDRMRFILAYSQESGWSRRDMSSIVKKISRLTARRLHTRASHHPAGIPSGRP